MRTCVNKHIILCDFGNDFSSNDRLQGVKYVLLFYNQDILGCNLLDFCIKRGFALKFPEYFNHRLN